MTSQNEGPNETVIELKNLTKIFGPRPQKMLTHLQNGCTTKEIREKTGHVVALRNISFSVKKGEIFVLMGLSGCGKSTLLRCLNRLIEPTTGSIFIDGEDITSLSIDRMRSIRRKRMGMVFQSFALLPHRNVLDNIAFGLEIQGIPYDERISQAKETLNLVGLSGYESSYPDQLSGGMQQRVGLARALASSPDILLMDEAFSALDPLIRRDMQNELLDIQDRLSKTIIFVSHDLDEALKLGTRIGLMKAGEIIQIGTPEEILTKPKDEFVERFVEDVDLSRVLTAKDVMKIPDPTIHVTSGPHVALRMMKEAGISTLFVVGKNRELKGIITVDDALRAGKEGLLLQDIINPDVISLSLDTPVSDIIPMIAESRFPIAVINEERRLKGVIVRGSVLSALSRTGAV
ncbi:MAG: Trehalose/maltose import ATP-binding protein MalK [Euryarchaeota archaeon ADurb.Bin294]|uniref:quaternary amine ABC transporter ATP-binding protein n=1 Tax=Methanospirillum sp. TaxID=45200 RepID=UPI0009D39D06|nr:glycine betaine/L-proline ABC transporter ATP-binding protein [Methanospirillum sp.]OQA54035.1 MAG: Trehalose/maltose import ATP-binding protein MalK [Euryarchaeota archaeon ADurb.Bin294]HPY60649.1 glycine betaine/L-proline ABC transporter ATP-binding protein [Methanospirillum sp.]HQC00460.1 glycine betaine/L-proline ABC transporter ATP-binding protein [Methanospirillum sp.]